jgi:hypothetical protein
LTDQTAVDGPADLTARARRLRAAVAPGAQPTVLVPLVLLVLLVLLVQQPG